MSDSVMVGITHNALDDNSFTFMERAKDLQIQEEDEQIQRKRTQRSPFGNWCQWNLDQTKNAMALVNKNPQSYRILLFFVEQMDNYNALICSYDVICEALDISQSTAKRAIKVLRDHNFIDIYKSGTTNVYTINKQLVWKSWGTNYKYAKFSANMIIAEREQPD